MYFPDCLKTSSVFTLGNEFDTETAFSYDGRFENQALAEHSGGTSPDFPFKSSVIISPQTGALPQAFDRFAYYPAPLAYIRLEAALPAVSAYESQTVSVVQDCAAIPDEDFHRAAFPSQTLHDAYLFTQSLPRIQTSPAVESAQVCKPPVETSVHVRSEISAGHPEG